MLPFPNTTPPVVAPYASVDHGVPNPVYMSLRPQFVKQVRRRIVTVRDWMSISSRA